MKFAHQIAQAKALFGEVYGLVEPERTKRLHELTTDDGLIEHVLDLLHESERKDGTLGASVSRAIDDLVVDDAREGDTFGVWRVVRSIGQGGMGSVFLVERSDGHFKQTAALKLLKGLPRAAGLGYFTRERQLLASLTHPNIARLLDGGASPEGQPYLVMEFVDGLPIDAYCRERGASREDVLNLFMTACDAVAFAHRQLIVHCDLKPSNLLVNKEGRPILLDFGIARLTNAVGLDQPIEGDTAPVKGAFTPRYASPEQIAGGAITTASDIYSLGVMLGELLDDCDRVSRKTPRLRSRELEAIVTKSTRPLSVDRYGSVDALCGDIQRYLDLRPVEALEPSASYRFRKLLHRRWPALLVAAAFIATIGGAANRVIVESRRAVEERDRALRAEAESRASERVAREVSAFLTSVFGGSNPDAKSGNVSTAVLLEQAFARVDSELSGEPGTKAQMYAALAGIQVTIERPKDALATYEKAITLERLSPRPLVLARMLMDISALRLKDFDGPEMISEAREALALVKKRAGSEPGLLAEASLNLAFIVGERGGAAEATTLFEQAIALARDVAPTSLALPNALSASAFHQSGLGHHEAAIGLLRERMALIEKLTAPGDEEHVAALESLGRALSLGRHFEEAESMFRRSIQQRRAHGSIETKTGAWNLAELARMLSNAGRPLEAIPLYREALSIADRKFAEDGLTRAVITVNLGTAAERAGDFALAGAAMKRGLEMAARIWKEGPPLAQLRFNYGRFLLASGAPTEAEAWARRAISGFESKLKADDASVLDARILLARILRDLKEVDEALSQVALVAANRSHLSPESDARLSHLMGLLACDEGRLDEGLERVEQAEELMLKALGAKDARSFLIRLDRAKCSMRASVGPRRPPWPGGFFRALKHVWIRRRPCCPAFVACCRQEGDSLRSPSSRRPVGPLIVGRIPEFLDRFLFGLRYGG